MSGLKNIRRFFKIAFKKNKFSLIVAFLSMLAISALDLCLPQLTRLILDDAIKVGKTNLLLKLVILYTLLSTISTLFNVLLSYICSKMKKKVSAELKIKLLKHLSKLSGNYYTNIKTGNMLSIIENDIFTVENFGAEILFSLIVDAISATIALFFLITMQLDLLLLIITIQLLITFSQFKFTKVISTRTSQIRKDAGSLSNLVQEYVSNILNVVISKSSFKFFKSYISKERNLIDKFIKLDFIISGNMAIATILSNLIQICIYGYGGLKIIKGEMTVGKLIAFQQYTGMFIGPCISIIRSNTRIQQSSVSLDRIFSILDEPITINQNNKGNRCNDKLEGNIVFDEVSFSYNEDERVINKINMKFEKGKITAIVGPSGCGKSTIVRLLFRLWDTNGGNLLIDNVELKNYNLKFIRRNISIVTQDLLLFDDNIWNNLTLGNKRIQRKYVEEVCKKVGIYDFINELPEGFETIVGEKGVRLSGGQKQRISIVRSLISNSKIIIFDEATSALDNVSQRIILENINEFLKNKTAIVIAHRLSTIKNADNIYVLHKGEVVEEGCHEELIKKMGVYYDFLNDQSIEAVGS